MLSCRIAMHSIDEINWCLFVIVVNIEQNANKYIKIFLELDF